MKADTIKALENLADGINELLEALAKEPYTMVNYPSLKLSTTCMELKHALGEETLDPDTVV